MAGICILDKIRLIQESLLCVLAVVPRLGVATWKGTSIPETLTETVRGGNAAFPLFFTCSINISCVC